MPDIEKADIHADIHESLIGKIFNGLNLAGQKIEEPTTSTAQTQNNENLAEHEKKTETIYTTIEKPTTSTAQTQNNENLAEHEKKTETIYTPIEEPTTSTAQTQNNENLAEHEKKTETIYTPIEEPTTSTAQTQNNENLAEHEKKTETIYTTIEKPTTSTAQTQNNENLTEPEKKTETIYTTIEKPTTSTAQTQNNENLAEHEKKTEKEIKLEKKLEKDNKKPEKKTEKDNKKPEKKTEKDNKKPEKKTEKEIKLEKKLEKDNKKLEKKTEKDNKKLEKKLEKDNKKLEKKLEKDNKKLEKPEKPKKKTEKEIKLEKTARKYERLNQMKTKVATDYPRFHENNPFSVVTEGNKIGITTTPKITNGLRFTAKFGIASAQKAVLTRDLYKDTIHNDRENFKAVAKDVRDAKRTARGEITGFQGALSHFFKTLARPAHHLGKVYVKLVTSFLPQESSEVIKLHNSIKEYNQNWNSLQDYEAQLNIQRTDREDLNNLKKLNNDNKTFVGLQQGIHGLQKELDSKKGTHTGKDSEKGTHTGKDSEKGTHTGEESYSFRDKVAPFRNHAAPSSFRDKAATGIFPPYGISRY